MHVDFFLAFGHLGEFVDGAGDVGHLASTRFVASSNFFVLFGPSGEGLVDVGARLMKAREKICVQNFVLLV